MELTEKEKNVIEFYKNFHSSLEMQKKELEFSLKNTNEKEKVWVSIYKKMPIKPHLQQILFNQDFNEQSIIDEMDTISKSILNK